MKRRIDGLLQHAIREATKGGALKSNSLPPLVLEIPKDPAFGDVATPVALAISRAERRPPREIAEILVAHIADEEGLLSSTEIAGPGFINLRLSPRFWQSCLTELERADLGLRTAGDGQRVLIEFVSGNPTGPLHIGHGRGAVTGDVVARLLTAAGHFVEREYYVNDAGRQIDVLGRSTLARLRQACGEAVQIPDDGYPGEYLLDLAQRDKEILIEAVANAAGRACPTTDADRRSLLADQGEAAVAVCAEHASRVLLELIREDLALCDIHFDTFVSELALRESGVIESTLDELEKAGLLYEREDARWFCSSRFGDEKDRVIVRGNGEPTYFASDIGYHRDKLRRGFDCLINIWGADHHGYIGRVRAAIQALGYAPEMLQVLLVQIVNLTRGGQPVRMGKRAGEFVTLREVVEEVGSDAARFFFLMRKSDSQLEFDLELAKKQGADNPVFYVQYAHARCCSILRQAAAAGLTVPRASDIDLTLLLAAEEVALTKQLASFGDVVEDATTELEPHRLVFHLIEVAGCFHRFYNRHRVLGEDQSLSLARLYLIGAVQRVVRQGLELLGIRAPESM